MAYQQLLACESRILSQALVRDHYKCVASGKFDFVAAIKFGIAGDEAIRAVHGVTCTELAHIVPQSTFLDVSPMDTHPSDKVCS